MKRSGTVQICYTLQPCLQSQYTLLGHTLRSLSRYICVQFQPPHKCLYVKLISKIYVGIYVQIICKCTYLQLGSVSSIKYPQSFIQTQKTVEQKNKYVTFLWVCNLTCISHFNYIFSNSFNIYANCTKYFVLFLQSLLKKTTLFNAKKIHNLQNVTIYLLDKKL